MLIEEGRTAPAFEAVDQDGKTHRLKDYRGKFVVLYFYPRDNTPGCTVQACGFRDAQTGLDKAGAVVLGVSRDSQKSHGKFAKRYGLTFPLLVDEGPITESYGTWVKKKMMGREYMGIARATFLIGPDGKVARVWPKVKPPGHAKEVRDAIAKLAAA